MFPDWAGTVVCIGSGPSLTHADCEFVRMSGRPTIVTNTTFRDCLWATALFAFDPAWWTLFIAEVKSSFLGRMFSQSHSVRGMGVESLAREPRFQSFGMSGTDAVSLAIGAGASDVVLLGYDCQLTDGKSHHHGDHPQGLQNCDSMKTWPGKFGRLANYAKAKEVRVLNASRVTALQCFERRPLEECL